MFINGFQITLKFFSKNLLVFWFLFFQSFLHCLIKKVVISSFKFRVAKQKKKKIFQWSKQRNYLTNENTRKKRTEEKKEKEIAHTSLGINISVKCSLARLYSLMNFGILFKLLLLLVRLSNSIYFSKSWQFFVPVGDSLERRFPRLFFHSKFGWEVKSGENKFVLFSLVWNLLLL